ncbi:nucleotide-binding universal stress UspA family protein [Streptomyces sp. SLBN-118]|uniref:universal stress protein n=1 Tax=Streptomyces sp. SLBN-118 TaxID=2768454 RepID=UPI0011511604|nr:universal stress protein [Streptomyces sp. SLBN-118]TQK50014.1 nucleotide-binding universal stress UspA family protein [Streptomyces sp. SLBN-118]
MHRHVVAGIDGSPESLAAAHWAAREALRRGLSLRLVHAWQWQPRPPVYVPAGTTQRYWAHRTLSQASDSVRAAHPTLHLTDESVAESPVTALLTAAEQAEMLVLGSRGLSSVPGFLVGSVSQAVVARAVRPVVLVRAGEEAADEQFPAPEGASPDRDSVKTSYRNIVLGLDTSSPCDELIEFAFDVAQHRAAALRVIHTFSAPPPYAVIGQLVPTPGPELLAEHEHAVSAALHPWREKFPEITVTGTVTEGRAASELTRASSGAGLVVVGRRIRTGHLGIHVGPVAHAVLHHVGCPVAVVPHV